MPSMGFLFQKASLYSPIGPVKLALPRRPLLSQSRGVAVSSERSGPSAQAAVAVTEAEAGPPGRESADSETETADFGHLKASAAR